MQDYRVRIEAKCQTCVYNRTHPLPSVSMYCMHVSWNDEYQYKLNTIIFSKSFKSADTTC